MTDDTQATEPTTTARPVRVPNVSPGAISGLGHQVIGAAAQDAHDATHGDYDDGTGDDVSPTFDPANPDHVDALVSIVPEDRQLAVRQALTGEVIDGQVVTDLDPAPRVEGTQAAADPASSLTGDGTPAPQASDPTNGALPTGEVHQEPVVPDDLADTVDARVAWAQEGQDPDEVYDRAALLLRLEAERETQRTTLVEPLRAITDAYETVPEPADS